MTANKPPIPPPRGRPDPKLVVEQIWALENEMAETLQKAIDNEILKTIAGPMLICDGWTEVMLDEYRDIPSSWISNNITGRFKCFGHYWYFEKERDAALVILRWA